MEPAEDHVEWRTVLPTGSAADFSPIIQLFSCQSSFHQSSIPIYHHPVDATGPTSQTLSHLRSLTRDWILSKEYYLLRIKDIPTL
jgi:hypothetical protein